VTKGVEFSLDFSFVEAWKLISDDAWELEGWDGR
jgi:hypothetical protein